MQSKEKLLADEEICAANRRLFERFFEFQEYKLKRINGLQALDDPTYKTLCVYVSRLRTVNRWFANKPWEGLTEQDIKDVYDDIEDGRIVTMRGTPFVDRGTYYRKILLGKPFELAGKKEIVKRVMAFGAGSPRNEVRFIREETFRRLIATIGNPDHRTLFWLAWDIGENVSSLLQLRKRDLRRTVNEHSHPPEYEINLRREVLKRSRIPRTEVTNYPETVDLLDDLLPSRFDDEPLFRFGTRMAAKALARAVRLTGATCIPNGEPVSLKDLRSSMACDLLSKGWTTDEVNQRLGHRPSSREIDKYVNWLALDRNRPRRRLRDSQFEALNRELQEAKDRERLLQQRLRLIQEQHGGM